MSKILLFFVAVLLLFGGGVMLRYANNYSPSTPDVGSMKEVDTDYTPPTGGLTEFDFTDQLGQPFNSKALDGKVWIGSFFFADCPSICKDMNSQIAKLQTRFADTDLRIVSITVAPEDDGYSKLWVYANQFDADHATWKFLTGQDIGYMRQVGVDFFQLAAADKTHTAEVALFNRAGERQEHYDVLKPEGYARLVVKLNELLSAKASDASSEPAADTETETETISVSQETSP